MLELWGILKAPGRCGLGVFPFWYRNGGSLRLRGGRKEKAAACSSIWRLLARRWKSSGATWLGLSWAKLSVSSKNIILGSPLTWALKRSPSSLWLTKNWVLFCFSFVFVIVENAGYFETNLYINKPKSHPQKFLRHVFHIIQYI